MSTSKDHEATPSLSIRGWPGVTASNLFPFVSESGPPKSNLFWRNRAFFSVASRSNPRCSKAQIASYWAQIRRFLVPTEWASSTSTTKKISPQATQAWLRTAGSGLVFLGNGWKRAVAVPDMLAAPSVEAIQWHTHQRYRTSTYPRATGFEGQSQPQLESRRPTGKQRACPEAHVTSHRFLYFWKWPAKKQFILAK